MRLIYIALGWTAGIILAANLSAISGNTWLIFAAVCLVALALVWRQSGYRLLMIALIALASGGWRYSLVPASSDIARYVNKGGLTIEGVVADEPDVRDDRIELRVSAETVTRIGQTLATDGLVLVQVPSTSPVHYGDRVTVTGLLNIPFTADTFSYADYLARTSVFAIMPNAALEVVSSGQGSGLLAALYDVKARLNRVINGDLPEPEAALLSGILLGNRRGIAPSVEDAFNTVGASHIIAISGFNMAIISGVVMGFLNRVTSRRKLAVVVGIGVLILYTIFVGANASVVRAAIMCSVLVIAPLFKRKTYVPTTLAFVALVMSALNPTVLWDVSFQLSFFATLGLALFATPLSQRFEGLLFRLFPPPFARTARDWLTEPLIVSIAAQITTLPLIILYFGSLSPVTLIVNLLVLPVQPALMILGALAVGTGLIVPIIGQLLFWLDMLFLAWTIGVVRAFAALPFASVTVGVDPRWIVAFLVIVIGGALMHAAEPRGWQAVGNFVRRRAVLYATAFSGFAIVFLTGAIFVSRPDGKLHVWWLDMGQSNAILLQTPGGAHVLVDGGRYPSRLLTDLGDRLPFNDRTIEVLVITQPDEFDYSALPSVLERYDIGITLTNGQNNLGDPFKALQAALTGHQIVPVRAGYSLDLDDGVRLDVLNPPRTPALGDSLDDNTLVLRVSYGQAAFLLTGDLSAKGQAALLNTHLPLTAAVMQLPEHGAIRTLDADFVKAVQPQIVVLQSDPADPPDPDTLKRLGATPLYRTDQGGTVHLWTDGHALWVVQEK